MTARRATLFLHIPKTAGTSITRFLYHRFHAQSCLINQLGHLSDNVQPDAYAFIAGHLDHDAVERFRTPPFVITCLRHPIDRALSAYYYSRAPRRASELRAIAPLIGAETAEQLLDDLRRLNCHATLAELLHAEPELAAKILGNVQTQWLAGARAAAELARQPDRLLNVAGEHLEACEGILLMERLPETLALMDRRWDRRVMNTLPNENVTPGRLPARAHDPAVLAALAELSALDMELYRHAEELIEDRLTDAAPGAPSIEALPDAADYTFDQPISGRGWHTREQQDGVWCCWTNREAVLYLSLATAGDHTLHCDVAHAACTEAWSDLAVSINGHELALDAKSDAPPGRLTARVPGSLLARSPDRVDLGFRVSRTVRPSDADPNNTDTRALGIALRGIQLTPPPA